LTPTQCLIIALASKVGAEYKVPELPALVVVESRAGEELVAKDRPGFGVGHMNHVTAREVLRKHPRLWPGKHTDEQIVIRLLKDHEWAMRLAAQRVKDTSLRAYNAGVRGARLGRGYPYLEKLKQAEAQLKECE